MRFELLEDARPSAGCENADVNVRVLQVGSDIDMIDADQSVSESDLARDDATKLTLDHFIHTQLSMFHQQRWSSGVREYWSIGVLEYWSIGSAMNFCTTPILHHSITSFF